MARIGLSSEKSRKATPASIISSTSAALPTLSMGLVSHMLESPTMTCRRRYFSASACGSSRVLMIGRLRVVAEETPSQMCSARWERQKVEALGVCSTLPAPQISWRVSKKGSSTSEVRVHPAARQEQIVPVTASCVSCCVLSLCDQVVPPADALVGKPLLGVDEQ